MPDETMAEDSETKADENTKRRRPVRMHRAAVVKKVAEMERAIGAMDARLRDLNAVKRTFERKDDARRKIIAGALALEHLKRNPDDQAVPMRKLIAEYVKGSNRRLFE